MQTFLDGASNTFWSDAVFLVVGELARAPVVTDIQQPLHAASDLIGKSTTSPLTCRAARPAVWIREVCERR